MCCRRSKALRGGGGNCENKCMCFFTSSLLLCELELDLQLSTSSNYPHSICPSLSPSQCTAGSLAEGEALRKNTEMGRNKVHLLHYCTVQFLCIFTLVDIFSGDSHFYTSTYTSNHLYFLLHYIFTMHCITWKNNMRPRLLQQPHSLVKKHQKWTNTETQQLT